MFVLKIILCSPGLRGKKTSLYEHESETENIIKQGRRETYSDECYYYQHSNRAHSLFVFFICLSLPVLFLGFLSVTE